MIGNGKTNNKPWNYCFKQQVTGSFWSMVGLCRPGYESKGPVSTGRNGSCNPPGAVKHTGQNLRLSEPAMFNPWSNLIIHDKFLFCHNCFWWSLREIAGHMCIWWGKNHGCMSHVVSCQLSLENLESWGSGRVVPRQSAGNSFQVLKSDWPVGLWSCFLQKYPSLSTWPWRIFSDTNYVGFDRTW